MKIEKYSEDFQKVSKIAKQLQEKIVIDTAKLKEMNAKKLL